MNSPEFFRLQEEYTTLTRGAGVARLARSRIELTGRDRAKFLHNFCTNDIKQLTPGTGCEVFFTSVQGKVLGHGHVLCEEDRLLFEGVAGQAQVLLPHLDKYLITEDVTLTDRSDDETTLLVAGAEAALVLREAGMGNLPAEPNAHTRGTIGGVAVSLARLPLCGEHSYLLTCPPQQVDQVQAALRTAGGKPCQEQAVDIARLEAGYPYYGQDITDANLPQEVDRNQQAISFTKGCYLGQETVARLDALGHVNKQLVGLKLDGETVPTAEEAIFATADAEKPVGQITSAVFSPRLGRPLALAYVRAQHIAPGSTLYCAGRAAEVIALPL